MVEKYKRTTYTVGRADQMRGQRTQRLRQYQVSQSWHTYGREEVGERFGGFERQHLWIIIWRAQPGGWRTHGCLIGEGGSGEARLEHAGSCFKMLGFRVRGGGAGGLGSLGSLGAFSLR